MRTDKRGFQFGVFRIRDQYGLHRIEHLLVIGHLVVASDAAAIMEDVLALGESYLCFLSVLL